VGTVARMKSLSLRAVTMFAIGIMILSWPKQANAHPIHTTLTLVTIGDAGRSLTLGIRAFADDFSASVARFAGRPIPRDSSASADDVTRYVGTKVSVLDEHGGAVGLTSCGVRRERELYWLCFRATLPAGMRGARINNQMLTELHADQVNIVQLEQAGGKTKKSYLFTRGSRADVLAP
jgi:hypothetical protein